MRARAVLGISSPGGPQSGFLIANSPIGRTAWKPTLGFDLYPYTEDAIAAVRRSVLQWRFIDFVAAQIDDAALNEAKSRKGAVLAYEIVYQALGER